MSGIIDDVTSAFSDIFGDGSDAVDAASDASDVASTADDITNGSDAVSSAANDASLGLDDASSASSELATSGSAISNMQEYYNNAGAAAYTAGAATGDFGTSFTSDIGSNAYEGIDNGEFNAGEYMGLDGNTPVYTNLGVLNATDGSTAAQGGFFQNAWNSTKSFLGLGTDSSASPTTLTGGNSGMSDLSKLMLGQMVGGLVSGAIQAGGAYLASKPKAPQNFSGRTPGGGGGGLGMSTNGFGLTAGGSTPAPTGVPSALIPNAQSEALGGSGGLATNNGSIQSSGGGAPNIQQTVANQAGFGGLIPQGAVNFMKGGGNG